MISVGCPQLLCISRLLAAYKNHADRIQIKIYTTFIKELQTIELQQKKSFLVNLPQVCEDRPATDAGGTLFPAAGRHSPFWLRTALGCGFAAAIGGALHLVIRNGRENIGTMPTKSILSHYSTVRSAEHIPALFNILI